MSGEPKIDLKDARHDDFFVGYLPAPPTRVRRTHIAVVALLAVGIVAVMALAGRAQRPTERGSFEFGVTRHFEGVLIERPVPMLVVHSFGAPQDGKSGAAASPGVATADATTVPPGQVLLVGAWKFGIPEWARAHAGKLVAFDGSLIATGSTCMVEMNDEASFKVLGPAPVVASAGTPSAAVAATIADTSAPPPTASPTANEGVAPDLGSTPTERPLPSVEGFALGTITIRGELVDTKCYLGVMRPGTGKVHRGCAVRCLSGGVPPGLLVRDTTGFGALFMLADMDGQPLGIDPELAARSFDATGNLELHGEIAVLRVTSMTLAPGY